MSYFLLFYEVVEDYAARRGLYREKHLALIDAAYERGDLLLAGAYGEPPAGAALLFRVRTIEEVQAFAEADPYVTGGIVLKWTVHPWHVVIGEGSTR